MDEEVAGIHEWFDLFGSNSSDAYIELAQSKVSSGNVVPTDTSKSSPEEVSYDEAFFIPYGYFALNGIPKELRFLGKERFICTRPNSNQYPLLDDRKTLTKVIDSMFTDKTKKLNARYNIWVLDFRLARRYFARLTTMPEIYADYTNPSGKDFSGDLRKELINFLDERFPIISWNQCIQPPHSNWESLEYTASIGPTVSYKTMKVLLKYFYIYKVVELEASYKLLQGGGMKT